MPNFNFDKEYADLLKKFSRVSCDRSTYFLHFLQSDHSTDAYKLFIRGLSDYEYFFILDLQLLLHRRCLDRLHKVFNN